MSEAFVGEIRMFAGQFAPRGYADCDGQLQAVAQNDALFSLLGTIYGGDGRTTFGLPDLRGRVPIHWGSGPGLTTRRIGQKGGAENVTLISQQMPSHSHRMIGANDTANVNGPEGNVLANTGPAIYLESANTNMSANAITGTGGSRSHENMMPFLAVRFIIALFGIYPSRT